MRGLGLPVTGSLLLVISVAALLSFFMLGSVTLFDVDEAVFAQATREMVKSGDWITPTYNGVNRYDKPILFYWLMGISYGLFGITEFGARFPSALCACLLALSLFYFVRRFIDDRHALYAGLSFVVSAYFLVYSHAAVTDMVLTLFISLSLFSFYSSTNPETGAKGSEEGEAKRFVYGFYAFSALAFLTKGLIGIVFPFGIALIYLLMTEGLKGMRKLLSGPGIVLFLIISLPWLVAQVALNGYEFIGQFFVKHHFKRYAGVISGHKGPLYYYLPVLIVGMFPWIAFVPAGVRNALRRGNRLLLFALIWVAVIGLFFSFSTTKLPNYLLPAIPAVSLLAASGMCQEEKWRRYGNIFIAVGAIALGAALLILKTYLPEHGIHDAHWTYVASGTMALMAAVSVFFILRKTSRPGVLAGLMVIFLFVIAVKALPLANGYLQGTLHRYSLYARDNLPAGEAVITYGINNPSIAFYSGHRLISASNKTELLPFLEGGKSLLAIAKRKDTSTLIESGFLVLYEDERYALLERR